MIGAIVTFFGVGHLRPAPGTWGSAAAVALAVLAYEAGAALLVPVGMVLATLIGFWAVPRAIAGRENSDPSEIVIDEVAGQWLALCFTVLPLWRHGVDSLFLGAWPGWVMPFLLFRLFDIWKPWLVGRADRRGDAAGVMLDDLWAGLFAGISSVILAGFYHGVLQPWLNG
jgi:phosphatidylglycerophosphatase A